MNEIFEAALEHTLRFEGGYVDHPKDPGGATNFGITRKTLAAHRGVSPWWKLPKIQVAQLQRGEVAEIYFQRYWKPCGAHLLSASLALVLFDFAVHSGPKRAVIKMQRIVGTLPDGQFGAETLAAVERYVKTQSEEQLVAKYIAYRHSFLKQLKAYKTFGRGWRNRLKLLANAAKKMRASKPKLNGENQVILNGYKTYIVAFFMLIAAALEMAGVDLPAIEGQNAAHLMMEAFALLFLRKGIKSEIAGA